MMDIDNSQPQDSDSVAIAAQSLRAAALLSRKRRKVAVEQAPALPKRPHGEQSMQLDYGQEEIATSPVNFFSTQNKVPAASEEPPPYSTPEIEDGQIREEGEISDTEDNAPPPAPRPTSPPPKFRRLEISSSKDSVTSRPVPTSPVTDSNPPLRSSTRLDSPFVPSKTASETESFHHPSPTFSHPYILENSTYRYDADHVRPGLAMTQDQYNTTKDTVLDLLGWGVPPEYLVDLGISRHVIFYVFTELNLRLPTNLDTTGLIPYPEMMPSAPPSPSHSIRSVSTSSAMPPPMTIPSHGEFSSPMAASGHTSDPPGSRLAARLGLRIPSAVEPIDVKMEPTSPSTADSPSSQSLHMIEQQRRQELLARKAATASRKAKQFDSPSGPSSIRDSDVEKAHVAATETVEDFLKSIPAVDNEITDIPAAARYSSPETMDVNETFVAPQSASSEGPSSQIPFASETSEGRSTISPATDAPPSSAHSIAPSSDIYSGASLSATSMPGDYMAASSSTTPTFASTTPAYDTNGLQRRGTKRPVAADFVDFDHGSGPSRAPSGNGYSSNGYIHPIPLLRRKTGSFAGVSGMRRCVIELSDSEDDGDGEGIGGAALYDSLSYSPMIASARPRLGGNGASYGFSNGEGRSTPPNAPLGMSPAALAEKEEEIKKMRQMIAQREELRQRKLAAMSGKGTPTAQPTAAGPSTTDDVVVSVNSLTVMSEGNSKVSIKQEDNAVFLHNGHVGKSEHVDAIMGNAQDNSELTTVQEGADNSMVIPLEEPASGESSDLTSANQTIGGVGFEPINYDGNVDDDQALMMTEEARLEQWVSSNSTLHQTAGESDVPSSSQVPKKESQDIQMSFFASYDSPFSSYPLILSQLRSATVDADTSRGATSHSARSSRHNASSAHDISSFSLPTSLIYCAPSLSYSSSTVFVPDLKPLKLATLQRALGRLTAFDSGLRVCQYEVPGGGVCRDKDCNDLHLSRLVSEPSDAELAAYVHGILPPTWRSRCDVRAVEIALERVRLGGNATNVDKRVRDALAGLGIPVTPSIES